MAIIDLTSASLLQSGVDLFYGAMDFRSKDNASDSPSHDALEFSAREAAEWISYFKQVNGVSQYLISGLGTHNHSLVNLQDVNTSGIANSDVLQWNQVTQTWTPTTNTTSDEKVKAATGDSAGYLDAKVDNVGIEVSANKLQLVANGVKLAKVQQIADDTILGSTIGGNVQQLALTSTYGVTSTFSGSQIAINTPQDLRTTATPTFNALTLSSAINGLFLNHLNSVSGVSIAAAESGKGFSNREATAEVEHTLPNPVQGLVFIFAVRGTDGIKIRVPSGKYIQLGASCSTAGGYALSTAVGSSLILLGIDDTYYQAISSVGTWSVDA